MCHPERRAKPEVEPAGRHVVSGSTQSGVTNPIVDPQNAMRFDFTKSAICRRFCKVRLLKHPTGMFYPLRMTQDGRCLAVLFCRRAIRESPLLGTVGVAKYGTENEVKSAFMCHPERSRNPSFARIE